MWWNLVTIEQFPFVEVNKWFWKFNAEQEFWHSKRNLLFELNSLQTITLGSRINIWTDFFTNIIKLESRYPNRLDTESPPPLVIHFPNLFRYRDPSVLKLSST